MGYREIYWASVVLIFMRINRDCLKKKSKVLKRREPNSFRDFRCNIWSLKTIMTKIYKTDSDSSEAQLPNVTKAVNRGCSGSLCEFGIRVGFYIKYREEKETEIDVMNTLQLEQEMWL